MTQVVMQGALLLEAIREVARVGGRLALRHYRSAIEVQSKVDGSPVTVADREAESTMRDWIGRRFPDDGIEGEEFGISRPGASRRWVLDPIDGTKTFVRGVPLWGTLVAVVEGSVVRGGAIYCPVVDEMVAAVTGEGAWWNGVRCMVSRESRLDHATVLTSDFTFAGDAAKRAAWDRLASRASVSRTWGDCYGYLLLATGRADAMLDGAMAPWDSAALQPIVEEAGGVFTDWGGTRTAFGGNAIATNFALAEPVRALVRAAP